MPLLILILFLAALGFWIARMLSGAVRARKMAREAVRRLEGAIQSASGLHRQLIETVKLQGMSYVHAVQQARLKAIPVDELKRHGSGLRLQAIRDAGLNNLADLQGWTTDRLLQLRGIGPDSAQRIASLVHSLSHQSNRQPIPHPSPFREAGAERPWMEASFHLRQAEITLAEPMQQVAYARDRFLPLVAQVHSGTGFWRWVSSRGKHPVIRQAIVTAETMDRELREGGAAGLALKNLISLHEQLSSNRHSGVSWAVLSGDLVSAPSFYQDRLQEHLGAPASGQHPTGIQPVTQNPPLGQAKLPVTPPPESTPRVTTQSPVVPSGLSFSLKVDLQGTPLGIDVHDPYGIGIKPTPTPISYDWVPAGAEVEVNGYGIPGGLVYVGSGLRSLQGYGVEPALINPAKSIDRNAANCHIRQTDYWPSYENITPAARASYLQWLSTGKGDPEADIGFVFLYFYGLERRVLAEKEHSFAHEWPLIEGELERLLSIYGQRGSLLSYAWSLLDFMRAHRIQPAPGNSLPVNPVGPGMRLELRYELGHRIKCGQPLSEEWAYAWCMTDPRVRLKTPAQRCPEAFRQAFCAEFRQRFPGGMKITPNKTMLKVVHRPASSSFVGSLFTCELAVPDVQVLTAPIQRLQEAVEAATLATEAYSRYIGRNEGQEYALEALLLLPPVLWPDALRLPLEGLRDSVMKSNGPKLMRLVDLQLALPEGGNFTKARMAGLGKALGGLGLGIEPDPRFGGTLPEGSAPIVLFPITEQESEGLPGKGFASAALLLHLASAVAGADGDFGCAEMELLAGHLRRGLDLPDSDYRRLSARLELFRNAPPSLTGLKKQLEAIDIEGREKIGDFLVAVAQADGVIDPAEVRSLEKLYKLLGLEHGQLYRRLHAFAPVEPVPVRAAAEVEVVHRIPVHAEASSSVSELKLDMAKVAVLKADSAKVAVLLGAIFAEPHPAEAVVEIPSELEPTLDEIEPELELIPGLDVEHQGLLQVLLQRPIWSRAELEELCSDRGLMVDGAIERINEAAFDRFDQALIEGDDPIEINCDLMLEEVA